jgi:flagellar export protein FliJ
VRRDRLATVLSLRERVERQRLAERAAADHRHATALQALQTAVELRAEAAVAPGTNLEPAQLSAHRVQVIALGDLVDAVEQVVHGSAQDRRLAARQLVAAAVQRRSVERLRDRRDAARTEADARRDERRLDEVALQLWRRSP